MKRRIIEIGLPILGVVACTSSSNTGSSSGGSTAAAVAGAQDAHCGTKVVAVDPGVCHAQPPADDGGVGVSDYGDTMDNAEGDDDDCKYHVKWTSTNVAEKTDVTFSVVVTNKKDGSPLTGAPVRAEVYLDTTHPGPNTNQTSKEGPSGTYALGPIQFDKPGKWTVRFHFHDDCNDSQTSPHGHAAFFVQVP